MLLTCFACFETDTMVEVELKLSPVEDHGASGQGDPG